MNKNQILIASPEKIKELANKIDLRKLWSGVEKSVTDPKTWMNSFISSFVPLYRDFLLYKQIKEFFNPEKRIKDFMEKSPFDVYHSNTYPRNFIFPQNHPVDGVIYVRSVAYENKFYPLADYFECLKREKMADFQNMCASLGAKSIKLQFVEDDEKKFKQNVGVQYEDVPVEGNLNFEKNKNAERSTSMEFQKTGKICRYDSPWIGYEPTWDALQNSRINNGLLKYKAEFNFSDDFGINASLAANYVKYGISIGGDFKSLKKAKEIYEVEFWPTDE